MRGSFQAHNDRTRSSALFMLWYSASSSFGAFSFIASAHCRSALATHSQWSDSVNFFIIQPPPSTLHLFNKKDFWATLPVGNEKKTTRFGVYW
jgi:hypothetical protein